jgi:GDP-L-fucose synthase
VDDAAEGILLATERYDGPEPVNLGAGFEISIRELAELIADTVGFKGRLSWNTSLPDGQPRRSLDTARAQALFGFRAQTAFKDGLRRTVDWYREHRAELARREAARAAAR